jgi:hypothetical protein
MEIINRFVNWYSHLIGVEQISPFRKTIFILLVLLTAGIIIRTIIREIRRFYFDLIKSKECQTWPKTEGVIIRSNLETFGSTDDVTFCNEVDYEYVVASKRYVSDKFSFLKGMGGNGYPKSCEAFQQKYHVGRSLEVFYNPNDPSEAILSIDNGIFMVLNRFSNTLFNTIPISLIVLFIACIVVGVACVGSPLILFLCLLVLPIAVILGLFLLRKWLLREEERQGAETPKLGVSTK